MASAFDLPMHICPFSSEGTDTETFANSAKLGLNIPAHKIILTRKEKKQEIDENENH